MKPLSHIAIIMDGNGRWAIKKNKQRSYGHSMGLKNIKSILNFCIIKKIKFVSLFVFSLDNWKRSNTEVSFLLKLLEKFLKKNDKYLEKNNIKIKVIGEKKRIKKDLFFKLRSVEKKTYNNKLLTVNLAFNYSSKHEIANALKKIVKIKEKKLTTDLISKNLYTKEIPDPEILIRTGGYCRLSDFMLWQMAYTEIFFIKKLWPDFSSKDLNKIINNFYKIKRNFGAVDE